MDEKYMMRIGAAAGVLGAIVFMAGNMLHARSADIEVYAEQIKAVAESDIWITDHLLFFVGAVLIGVFLVALHRTMLDGLPGALSRIGYFGTVASTAVVTVLVGLDGMASKAIHNAWAAAPASEKAVALRIAEAMEEPARASGSSRTARSTSVERSLPDTANYGDFGTHPGRAFSNGFAIPRRCVSTSVNGSKPSNAAKPPLTRADIDSNPDLPAQESARAN